MGNLLAINIQNNNQTQITDDNRLNINFKYLKSIFSKNINLRINDKSNNELKNLFDLFVLLNLDNYVRYKNQINIGYQKNYIKINYFSRNYKERKLVYDIRKNTKILKKKNEDLCDRDIPDYFTDLFFTIMCLINIVQIQNNLFCDETEEESFYTFLNKCKKVKIPNEILKIMKECFTNLIIKNQKDFDIIKQLIEDNNIKINDNEKIINEKKILLENITENIKELQNQIKNLTDSTQKIKIIEYNKLSSQFDLVDEEIIKINSENKKIIKQIQIKNITFKSINDNLLKLKKAIEIIDFSIIINQSTPNESTLDEPTFVY